MKGWHKESYRHYLAGKGIKTSYYAKRRSPSVRGVPSGPASVVREYEGRLAQSPGRFETARFDSNVKLTPLQSDKELSEIKKEIKRKGEIADIDKKISDVDAKIKEEARILTNDLRDRDFRVRDGKLYAINKDGKEEEMYTVDLKDALKQKKKLTKQASKYDEEDPRIEVLKIRLGTTGRMRVPVVTTKSIREEIVEKEPRISAKTTPQAFAMEDIVEKKKPVRRSVRKTSNKKKSEKKGVVPAGKVNQIYDDVFKNDVEALVRLHNVKNKAGVNRSVKKKVESINKNLDSVEPEVQQHLQKFIRDALYGTGFNQRIK